MAAPTMVPTATEPPFVGLKAYTEDQANRFFGRDRECETLIGNLRAARLTLLYAESGVGKSSLLRAGLAAELRRHAQRHLDAGRAPRLLPVLFSAYSEEPVQGLVDAVAEAVRPFVGGLPPLDQPSVAGVLEQATSAVGATVLVLLDQFEEYFLYRSRHSDTDRFADEIAACVRRRDLNANFLISIREDSYARLGDLFRGRIDDVFANFLHLDHLGRAGGEEAIRGPVNWFNGAYDAGVVVEDALVEEVLDGVQLDGDRIETTYLQLVMERVWEQETREGSSCLRAATLLQMGGARAVIAGHLDHTMDRFSEEDQRAAAAAFRFLVTRGGTKIALSVGDLSELSEVPVARLDPLLRRLAEPDVHILRPVEQRAGDEAAYEIYHDALARPILEWRAGRQRREDEARREALARQVEQERAEKEHALQLEAEARRLKGVAERGEARARRLLAIGAVIMLGLAAAVVVSLVERARARQLARVQTSDIIASRLDDLTRPLFGEGQKALAAFEAYRLSPTFDARGRVQSALQGNVGMPVVLQGHQRAVLAVAWDPGPAGLLATGGSDDSVRLWRPDGRPLGPQRVAGGISQVTALRFTPNGKLVVASRDNGTVDFWAASARPLLIRSLRASDPDGGGQCATEDPCHPIALTPDGETLVTVLHDDKLALWRMPGQDPGRIHRLATVSIGDPEIHSLAFSRTGELLAVGSTDGVSVWRVAHGRLRLARRPAGGAVDAYSVSWSPTGELAVATDDGLRRWNPAGRWLRRLNATANLYSVAFAHGGTQLVTGGDDDQVTVWDDATLHAVGVPRPHADTVNAVAVSPDGERIAAGDNDAVAKIWPVQPKGALAVDAPALGGAWDLASLPGRILATYTRDPGSLRLWRLQGPAGAPRPPRPLAKLAGDGPFAAGGSRLVATAAPSYTHLAVWDIRGACARAATRSCRHGRRLSPPIYAPYDDQPPALALDRSGTTLAVGSTTGLVTLWDIRDPGAVRRLARFEIGGASACRVRCSDAHHAVAQLAFDPAARLLLVRVDSAVRLLSYAAAGRTHRLRQVGPLVRGQGLYPVEAAAFSPGGRLLAVGGDDQTVTLLNLADPAHPRLLGTLQQNNSIFSLAFTPDGRTLAAGDGEGKTCVYDLASLRATGAKTCLLSPDAFGDGNLTPIAFDSTGATLITDTDSRYDVSLWSSLLWTQDDDPATTARLNAAVCRLAGRNLTAGEWGAVFSGTQLAGHRHRTCPGLPPG